MKRTLANIGCYSVVAVLIIGSVVSLLGSVSGRSTSGIIFGISEIKSLLSPFTGDVSGLLSQILRPNVHGYDLKAPESAYQGGSPVLIQNPHDPERDHCHQRMRFLFQFGEIIPGLHLADAGVGYVYGCDHYPHYCKAFLSIAIDGDKKLGNGDSTDAYCRLGSFK
jgi:hypothetical protein